MAHDWTYVYSSPTAPTAHLLPEQHSPNSSMPALCGATPQSFRDPFWFGTGTQAEYDRADALPVCENCSKHRRKMQNAKTLG